jgi:hypothetical protein
MQPALLDSTHDFILCCLPGQLFFQAFLRSRKVLNPFGKLPPIYYFINNLQEEIEIGISSSGA